VNAIDAAFATAAEERLAALIVDGDALFATQRDRMAALAARHRISSTYPTRSASRRQPLAHSGQLGLLQVMGAVALCWPASAYCV
jgi:diphthamide biosynthesis methyltransferase